MFEASPSQERSTYEPLGTLATVTCIALALEALRDLASFFGAFVQIHGTKLLLAGDEAARPTLVAALHLQARVAAASLLMTMFIVPCFMLWFYRAHRNLASFRTPPLEYSHSATVWSFVVPIASLVMPLWVMQEVWKGSDPNLPRGETAPFDVPRSGLVEGWWGTFILRGFLTIVYAFQVKQIKDLADIITYSYAQMAMSGITLIAAVLAGYVVIAVSKRQTLCAKLPAIPAVAVVHPETLSVAAEEPSTG